MASTLSSLSRKYSTLRKVLPFLVRQTYITNASLPLPYTRCKSNRPIKSICDSQHCALKALLLMWSSPAALVNVKSSDSRMSTGCQSFFSHAAYHLRIVSSLFGLSPASACGLAICGMPAAAASAHAPASRIVRRDTAPFFMTHFSLTLAGHWIDGEGCAVGTVSSSGRLFSSNDETAIQHSDAGGRCSLRRPRRCPWLSPG